MKWSSHFDMRVRVIAEQEVRLMNVQCVGGLYMYVCIYVCEQSETFWNAIIVAHA